MVELFVGVLFRAVILVVLLFALVVVVVVVVAVAEQSMDVVSHSFKVSVVYVVEE